MNIIATLNQATKKIPHWLIYILGVGLVTSLFYNVFTRFIPDPQKYLEFQLGEWALKFLVASLLITPIRNITGVNLVKYRRALGLTAFFMAMAHLSVYLFLDVQLEWRTIVQDITRRPYIMFGVLSFVVMIPLAITSRDKVVRKMGPIKWGRLHKLTYIAIIGAVLHFVLLKKTWETEPLVYCGIALVLLVYRDVARRRKNAKRARSAG